MHVARGLVPASAFLFRMQLVKSVGATATVAAGTAALPPKPKHLRHLRPGPFCVYHRGQHWRCRLKLQRIISLVTLAISILTLILVLRRPAPVAAPVAPAVTAANAQSFQEKVNRLAEAKAPGEGESEIRMNAGELTAALTQAAGMLPPNGTTPGSTAGAASSNTNGSAPSPSPGGSMEFPGPVPNIKDYQVSMDGDIVRGQFLTQIAGKDVYLTLAGHLGSKDGYATFDATEVKIGDLSVPASLVNEVLRKKLAEQRDQLKLPANVKDIRVENGELVLVEK
jgi:hypothetical protein